MRIADKIVNYEKKTNKIENEEKVDANNDLLKEIYEAFSKIFSSFYKIEKYILEKQEFDTSNNLKKFIKLEHKCLELYILK